MINRYQGNSGRVMKIDEQGEKNQVQPVTPPLHTEQPQPRQPAHGGNGRAPSAPRNGGGIGLQSMLGQLGKLLPGGLGKQGALETEDIILLLILYLMYRESGDRELLMMMGAMFLL